MSSKHLTLEVTNKWGVASSNRGQKNNSIASLFSLYLVTVSLLLTGCTIQKEKSQPAATVAWFMKNDKDFPVDVTSRALLIGTWVSESDDTDGTHRVEEITRHPNGRYEALFQSMKAGNILTKQTEVGLWGVSGRVYFTITQGVSTGTVIFPVNPEDASFYDAYIIRNLSGKIIEYDHASGGQHFKQQKVDTIPIQ